MSDEWLRDHKGAYVETVGYVWECYDECHCEQAMVVSYYRNKTDPRFRVSVCDWEGEFYTECEQGAERDLAEYRRQLRETDPAREAAIRWQEGVDYGAQP